MCAVENGHEFVFYSHALVIFPCNVDIAEHFAIEDKGGCERIVRGGDGVAFSLEYTNTVDIDCIECT